MRLPALQLARDARMRCAGESLRADETLADGCRGEAGVSSRLSLRPRRGPDVMQVDGVARPAVQLTEAARPVRSMRPAAPDLLARLCLAGPTMRK